MKIFCRLVGHDWGKPITPMQANVHAPGPQPWHEVVACRRCGTTRGRIRPVLAS